MSKSPLSVDQIFAEALLHVAGQDRSAYLDAACAGDAGLRQRVDRLLRAYGDAASFLESPVVDPLATINQPVTEKAGAQIGPYRLLQQIGEGGMGMVYMAEQAEPIARRVALKIIKLGMDTRQVIARFEAERHALALMDHVNIARVLDAGTTEAGRPYFVMELVHGVPITKYCDDNRLTPRQRLELFVPVCQAIQHAHQKGIIHRDVKPSNVMVTLYDGKPVPKVIDFGVAKAIEQKLTERTLFTQYGTMVGTLEYMSPEQAEMSALGVDTRSDIYSLGVLLYELLTGSTPLRRERVKEAAYAEILRLIKEEEPPKPSTRLSNSGEALASISAQRHTDPDKLSKLMRGELDWIVMKTLEKDRNRRYETANGFAADLQRYLNDEPVHACPPSAMYRFRKLARKNRVALTTAGTIAVLLIAGIVVSSWQALRATNAERETAKERDAAKSSERRARSSEAIAQQRRQEAIDAGEELRDTLYAAEMNLIQAAWDSDNLPRVRDLLSAQIPKTGQRELRGFEWHYWDRLCNAEVNSLQLPDPFPEDPWSLPMFTRDGMRLAALVTKGAEQELQVWDAATGFKRLAIPLPGGWKQTHAISADGERIATIPSQDREKKGAPFDLRVRDANTGNELAVISVPGVGPEQSALLSINADGSRILTVVNSVQRPDPNPVSHTATSQLNVWNVATGKVLLTVPLGSVRLGPALSPDGTRAAAIVSLDGMGDIKSPHVVKMWDVETGKELQIFKGSSGEPFNQVVFSPDGKQLAASGLGLGGDGIWIWDAATGKELRAIGGRRTSGLLRFSPDGRYLANYSRHGLTVTIWDTATGQPWSVFKGHTSGVIGVAFDADGRQLRTVAYDGTIRTWNIPPIERPSGTIVSSIRMARMAISLDGTCIADLPLLGPDSQRIEILDISGKRMRLISLPDISMSPEIDSVVLSRGGARLAVHRRTKDATGETAQVRVWDTSNGKELLHRTEKGWLAVARLAISPDGNRVALPFAVGPRSASGFQRIGGLKLIDVTSGQEVQSLELNPHPNACLVEFSPDGKRLATLSLRSTESDPSSNQTEAIGQLWDVATGMEIARLESDTWGFLSTVTFSPDGSLLAVGLQLRGAGIGQAVIDVLETASGRKCFTLRGHADRVLAIAFSPDGRRVASSAMDPTIGDSEVRLWDTASGKGLSTLTCHGAISGLAFRFDGHQLIGVRMVSPDTERGAHIWDATPRPQPFARQEEKR